MPSRPRKILAGPLGLGRIPYRRTPVYWGNHGTQRTTEIEYSNDCPYTHVEKTFKAAKAKSGPKKEKRV